MLEKLLLTIKAAVGGAGAGVAGAGGISFFPFWSVSLSVVGYAALICAIGFAGYVCYKQAQFA
jgi:hypothetical protein